MQQPPGYPPGPQYPYGPPPPPMAPSPQAPKGGLSTAAMTLIILAAVVALGGGGCVLCVCIGLSSSTESKSVRASELISAYRSSESRADTSYRSKVVSVRGGVVDFAGRTFITLATGSATEVPELQCNLKSGQGTRASRLGKGSRVTVRGKVRGLLFNVQLDDCEIQ